MNWTIAELNRTLPDGVVMTAHWRVSKTDGGASASVYGTISIPTKVQRQYPDLGKPNNPRQATSYGSPQRAWSAPLWRVE